VKLQPFKCERCKLGAAVIGFWCLCQSPAIPEIHFTARSAPIVAMEPNHYHTTESPIVYEVIMWPAAVISTATTGMS